MIGIASLLAFVGCLFIGARLYRSGYRRGLDDGLLDRARALHPSQRRPRG